MPISFSDSVEHLRTQEARTILPDASNSPSPIIVEAALTSVDDNGSRDRKGRFTKGNPGKPKGARSQSTLAIEKLLGNEATRLAREAIKAALAGDSSAL